MTEISVETKGKTHRISINNPKPVVRFDFSGAPDEQKLIANLGLSFKEQEDSLTVTKPLGIDEHLFGLGEKAFELDRRRTRVVMWNTDAYGYRWGTDPMYVSIPFFISIENGKARGFFFNSPSKMTFDFGITRYDQVIVTIPQLELELFVFDGPSVQEVVEQYVELTGKPLDPPLWAFGYQASRYTYFPQDYVIDIIKKHKEKGIDLAAIYLDIDYMEKYKDFTWGESFPEPKRMLEEAHRTGVKVVTIVDHAIRAEQGYEPFLSGMGHFCELQDGNLYVDRMWPGTCVFPDFFNDGCRNWWGSEIRKWAEQGVDGIWLDMNEPATLTQEHDFRGPVVHKLDDGRKIRHELVRNAYPYFEAMSTYEALKTITDKPFVLSRAGYAGIQKYAMIWTGDNSSTEEAIPLQLSLVLSLSISGIPFVGCDLGGFAGRSNPSLVLKYYRAALFFPLYRNHKEKSGNDQEPFSFYNEEEIKEAIALRQKFLPYIYSLAREAHETGHPIVRPLLYEFQDDPKTYGILDEYMVGSGLLYAPQIYEGSRKVYLPKGKWADFWSCKVIEGPAWISSDMPYPIFIREGHVIPTEGEAKAFGTGSITLYDGSELSYDGKLWRAPSELKKTVINQDGSCKTSRFLA
ncbi:alpha-glucosidase MalA [Tardisphaera saccharovorans]